jgi:type II secretory pathway pseudopilin PulG
MAKFLARRLAILALLCAALMTTLASQSKALRKLGQAAEADKLDQRAAQIHAATVTPNEGLQSGSQNPN